MAHEPIEFDGDIRTYFYKRTFERRRKRLYRRHRGIWQCNAYILRRFRNGKAVAYPTVTPEMRNKKLDLPVIKQKGLEVQIVYVKSTKKNDDVVATYYRVVQDGYPPTVVRVNSNVNELGMRFRSIVIPPEGEDPPPAIDQTYGCGGSSPGHSNGTSN
ncbi:MAG: hypothetical protein IPJ84_05930 [Bdellovibrionales bacterium]|nr:hypothetical protein [Bdellovibrionales bacterium]